MRVFLLMVWLAAAAMGFGWVARFDSRPGAAASPVERWPAFTSMQRNEAPLVLMFLHPQCPCSRASLEELSRLLSRSGGPLSTTIVAFAPSENPERWRKTAEKAVSALPGAILRMDPGGVEARRFGATTSGHLVIFDSEGRRLYSGGITGSRAMAGDNAGFDKALEGLRSSVESPSVITPTSMPVYGCPILP